MSSPKEVLKGPIYEVLIVDDSNMNRKMLMKCLEAQHHICEYAADGIQVYIYTYIFIFMNIGKYVYTKIYENMW
jgi:PleD family two-component response regulator